MLTPLFWVVAVVGALVLGSAALLLVLLVVPVGVDVSRADRSERLVAKVHWLFGIVRIPLTGVTRDRDGKKRRPRTHRAEKRSRSPKPGEIPVIARTGATLLRRLLRRIRITADGDVWAGLEDPADTGLLWGLTAPIVSRLTSYTGVRVHPAFSGAEVAFVGYLAVDVVPATLAGPVLRFFLSRDGRTVVRILRGRP